MVEQAKELVSTYGKSKKCELFAETFTEYFGEEKPRKFAKIFVKTRKVNGRN